MNMREILTKLGKIEQGIALDEPTSVNEGIWDSIKAWAGDEGAKARQAIEQGAKAMLKRFQRFAGPYEKDMREDETKFFEVLRTFLLSVYPLPIIKDALVRTQKEVDVRAFTQYVTKVGSAKSQLGAKDEETEKNDQNNPFDIQDIMSGLEVTGPALMEREAIMEATSKKQLMTLFINLIVVASEQDAKEPIWMAQEMKKVGGGDVFQDIKDAMSGKPAARQNPADDLTDVIRDYQKLTGDDPQEFADLAGRVTSAKSFGKFTDPKEIERLAKLGYSYIKQRGR